MTNLHRAFAIIVLILSGFISLSQPKYRSSANIGLVYPLSTNGTQAQVCGNWISINAIAGISAEEYALALAGVCNVVRYNATGITAAGVTNIVHGNANAVQLAGISNITSGNVNGLQAAGILNTAKNVNGLQLSGFANMCNGAVQGAQFAGFVNKGGKTHGQFGGFCNIAREIEGIQVAGFNNIARGRAKGLQVAGFSNQAQSAHAQVSGFVNTAGDIEGMQVAGFMNVARKVRGVQISGFINIADSSDYPIGLINLVKQGEKAIGVSVDEKGTTMATFRSGGKVMYGLIGAGFNYFKSNGLYAIGAGIGAHLKMTRNFRVSVEAGMNSMANFDGRYYFSTGIKVFPSLKLKRLELYAGPTLNFDTYSRYIDPFTTTNTIWSAHYRRYEQNVHVGGVAGLQVHL